jgi:hypothetical protein
MVIINRHLKKPQDIIADRGNQRTVLPAASLRSFHLKAFSPQRAQRKTRNPDLSGAS